MMPTDDKELLNGIVAGQYEQFSALYQRYAKPLTDYGLKFTADTGIVRDCVHDLFVSLWVRRAELQIHTSLRAYLIKAVRTSVLQKVKRSQKMRPLSGGEDDYLFHLHLSPEQVLLQTEDDRQLRQSIATLLARLSPRQKEVIYLRYYQDLSFEEIAAQLGMTVNACYKNMHRALVELRKTVPLLWLMLMQAHPF